MYTDNLINKIESYLPNEEVSKIIGAFEFAKDAHEGQKRKTGHRACEVSCQRIEC